MVERFVLVYIAIQPLRLIYINLLLGNLDHYSPRNLIVLEFLKYPWNLIKLLDLDDGVDDPCDCMLKKVVHLLLAPDHDSSHGERW